MYLLCLLFSLCLFYSYRCVSSQVYCFPCACFILTIFCYAYRYCLCCFYSFPVMFTGFFFCLFVLFLLCLLFCSCNCAIVFAVMLTIFPCACFIVEVVFAIILTFFFFLLCLLLVSLLKCVSCYAYIVALCMVCIIFNVVLCLPCASWYIIYNVPRTL